MKKLLIDVSACFGENLSLTERLNKMGEIKWTSADWVVQ